MRELVEAKRDEIEGAHGLQNFHIECNETIVSRTGLSNTCFLLELAVHIYSVTFIPVNVVILILVLIFAL